MWLKVANLRKTCKDSSPKPPLIWYFVAGREVVGELPTFHRGTSDESVSNEFLLRFFCKIFRFHFGRTNYFLGTSLKTVELPRKHQWCSLPLVQAPSPQGHLGWLQWLGADVWWLRFISGSFQRFEEISNIPLEHTPDPTIHTSLWRKFFHTF